jgi:hypothetical protein
MLYASSSFERHSLPDLAKRRRVAIVQLVLPRLDLTRLKRDFGSPQAVPDQTPYC